MKLNRDFHSKFGPSPLRGLSSDPSHTPTTPPPYRCSPCGDWRTPYYYVLYEYDVAGARLSLSRARHVRVCAVRALLPVDTAYQLNDSTVGPFKRRLAFLAGPGGSSAARPQPAPRPRSTM